MWWLACGLSSHSAGLSGVSISECQEEGDASTNPRVLIAVGRQLNVETEVGGVTRRGQGTRTGEHLVARAVVDAGLGDLAVLDRHEPDDWHFGVQLFGLRVVQQVDCVVPAGALQEHAIAERTILGFLCDLGVSDLVIDLELE